MSKNVRLIT